MRVHSQRAPVPRQSALPRCKPSMNKRMILSRRRCHLKVTCNSLRFLNGTVRASRALCSVAIFPPKCSATEANPHRLSPSEAPPRPKRPRRPPAAPCALMARMARLKQKPDPHPALHAHCLLKFSPFPKTARLAATSSTKYWSRGWRAKSHVAYATRN